MGKRASHKRFIAKNNIGIDHIQVSRSRLQADGFDHKETVNIEDWRGLDELAEILVVSNG
jgi:hypothetical protein